MRITRFHLYVGKRLAYTFLTVFLVATVVFISTVLLPGNAAETMLGRVATPEAIAALERELGLNKPLHVQYYDWLIGFLTGNPGQSISLNEPVVDVVKPRFTTSLVLATSTLAVTVFVAIPLGVLAGVKNNSLLDRFISTTAYLGVSLPEFVTGSLLIVLVAGPILDIFPSSGYVPLSEGLIPWLSHAFLPVTTLTVILVAHIFRQTRSELIEELQSAYVRTARLKGMGEWTVLFKHALRNALLPTITIIALNFGWLMGSLVVVEEIFVINGLGRLVVHAISSRDVPLLQFLVIVIATIYTIANLGADLMYSYLDPRIDYGSEN